VEQREEFSWSAMRDAKASNRFKPACFATFSRWRLAPELTKLDVIIGP
jgi:hypothetical protein